LNPKHHFINPYFKLEAGKVVPVIGVRYPLSEVAEALRYLDEGHAKGKVVVTLEHKNKT
jgi:NADPH:quinone reductase-like Zn-dependent oxidoreductase